MIAAAKRRHSVRSHRCSGVLVEIAESERARRDAVDVLAGLEPGPELALAYATLADLVAWEDAETAVAWAMRANALAERLDESAIVLGARVTIDVVGYMNGALESGRRLERTLALADQAGLERQAGRIWVNLAWIALRQRTYADVDRYVEAGIAYCAEHDLEIHQRYLHSSRARAALDRARWSEATDVATLVLHDPGPSIIPTLCSLVVLGLVRARRGDPQPSEPLDRAAALAERHGRLYTLAPVAVAGAEAAWLEGGATKSSRQLRWRSTLPSANALGVKSASCPVGDGALACARARRAPADRTLQRFPATGSRPPCSGPSSVARTRLRWR